MSNENLQQAADREHGNTPPSLIKVVGLVFVVAFVLVLFSFLMELRGNEEESQTLASVIEERQSLREQVGELEDELAALETELADTKAAAEAEWKEMDNTIWFLEQRVEELTRKTAEKMQERAAMLGLTLGQAADMNEVRLSSLVKEFSRFEMDYYYDRANRCYYAVAAGAEPVADAVVVGYMSAWSRFFDYEDVWDTLTELYSVTGLLHSGHWVGYPEDGQSYYETDFEMDGSDYLIRIYTGGAGLEDDRYDGASLFELVLVE